MRLFPKRDANETREAVRQWSWVTFVFLGLAIAGIGVFALSGGADAGGTETLWGKFRWIALIVGLIAGYLAAQSVFHVLVEATIGPERFIAIFAVLMAVAGIAAWLSQD